MVEQTKVIDEGLEGQPEGHLRARAICSAHLNAYVVTMQSRWVVVGSRVSLACSCTTKKGIRADLPLFPRGNVHWFSCFYRRRLRWFGAPTSRVKSRKLSCYRRPPYIVQDNSGLATVHLLILSPSRTMFFSVQSASRVNSFVLLSQERKVLQTYSATNLKFSLSLQQ